MPVLTTARLLIAIPGAQAAAAEARFYLENIEHLAPWEPPITAEHFDEVARARHLEANRLLAAEGTSYRFSIFERERGAHGPVLGHINLHHVVRGFFLASTLGYNLSRDAQGHGYMTEACKAVIAFAFDDLGLHRLMANHMPQNKRSAAVLQGLGFTVEGMAKDYLFLAGAWRDHVLTALTSPRNVVPG